MSMLRLIRQTVTFYWRTNLGVLLTVVVSSAVLTGALTIGDSVHYSLIMLTKSRLGRTDLALVAQNRFFRAALADEIADKLDVTASPILNIRGLVSNDDGSKRANRVEVRGVDKRFYTIGSATNPWAAGDSEGAVVNTSLAAQLNVTPGDEIVLRVEQPSLMPRDMPLTPDTGLSTAFRLKVLAVADAGDFGRFNLQANQLSPLNVFVSLQWLGDKLQRPGQANMLLLADESAGAVDAELAEKALHDNWQLADAELELRQLANPDVFELRSRRVFIDESVSKAALETSDQAGGIMTYFVNELRSGNNATPFSMVAALAPSQAAGALIPPEMADDEIIVNQWLADDIAVEKGGSVKLTYYVVGPMRKLIEESRTFTVRSVVPVAGPSLDPNLMPDFPGLTDAENCRDWDSGLPVDFDKIRDKDEDYWDDYRGTPKAFVTLSAGRDMWANRYGDLTAVRYPADSTSREEIINKLRTGVDPASVGLFFQPVRQRGMQAGGGSTDFTQLFVGLSIFLVIAAVLLTALVFVFGVESRSGQIGILKALGLEPKSVGRLFWVEGSIVAAVGAAIGAGAGLLYAWSMVYALSTVWSGAVAGSLIAFHVDSSTLLLGIFIAILVSLIAMWLTLRKHVRRSARELLAGDLESQYLHAGRTARRRYALWIAVASAIGAIIIVVTVGGGDSASAAGAFFGAAALLLLSGLSATRYVIARLRQGYDRPMVSLAGLGLRNSTRRGGRSLAVVALLACGVFLTVAVGANRQSPDTRVLKRKSGTGGFALYAESSLGILHDLSSASGRKSVGLDEDVMEQVGVVQLRLREGDDASCLNLNRAQTPRLLGVNPETLQSRDAFIFTETIEGSVAQDAWNLLDLDLGPDVAPAVGDYASVYWALGKSIGDEIELSDEKGRPFRVRIVGMLKNSILQGSLLISEQQFVQRYPSEEGYRVLLIDAPADKAEAVSDEFSLRMTDYGLSVSSTTRRLAEFGAVQNTYLSMFQTLGGLSLVLGSVGLGLVVLRNLLERRGELAMLRAVGFDKAALKKMVLYEHFGLMLAGLVCGLVAAVVAVGPAMTSPGSDVPYLSLAAITVIIAASGLLWIWLASTLALSSGMLDALRNE